jgi:hypothetical protein
MALKKKQPASAALKPSASPGEVSAIGIWGALSALLIAFGVDPARAAAMAGMAGAVAPYAVKAVIAWRKK